MFQGFSAQVFMAPLSQLSWQRYDHRALNNQLEQKNLNSFEKYQREFLKNKYFQNLHK